MGVSEDIRINFEVITSQLDAAANKLKSMGNVVSSFGSSVSSIGTKLTMGVTAPIAGLVGFGVKYNSTMQDLETSFKVMLGSQEKAKKMSQDLIRMGAATPFESEQLADYTKTLLSFGYTQKNVLPIMSRLGDISLGNNEKMGSMTRTMGQINALGKLQGGDLNQLIGQGWNPLNEITKKTGETMEEVRKRMSKGKVTYKEVEQALVSATSKGGQFYKGMDEGSKTFSGRISTLKDTFAMFAGELTKPIFDKLMDILPRAIEFISKLSKKFTDLSPGMKKIILIGLGVAAAIGPILVGVGGLITMIGGVITAIGTIGSVVAGISLPVLGVVAGISALVIGIVALGAALIKAKFGTFQNALKALSEHVSNFVKNAKLGIQFFIDGFKKAGDPAALDGIFSVLYKFGSKISDVFSNIKLGIQFFIDGMRKAGDPSALEGGFATIYKIGSTLVDLFSMLKQNLQSIDFTNLLQSIKGIWESLKIMFEVAKPILKVMAINIGIMVITAISLIGPMINAIKNIATIFLEVGNILRNTIALIIALFQGDFGRARKIISNIWTSIKNIFKTYIKNIYETVAMFINNMVRFFSHGKFNGLPTTVGGVLGRVKTKFIQIINYIKEAVRKGLSYISEKFGKLKIKFPKIPLPHFKVSGSFDLKRLTVPKLSLSFYKDGTNFAAGGMALVGENGPELINMKRGSQVFNNSKTNNILSSSNKNVTINYSGSTGTSDRNSFTNMLKMAGVS